MTVSLSPPIPMHPSPCTPLRTIAITHRRTLAVAIAILISCCRTHRPPTTTTTTTTAADSSFKKRAPHAVKEIRKFALAAMGTKDIRLDPTLNEAVWTRGIKNVPRRLRVRLARRRNEDDGAEEKLYTLVTPVQVNTFKGLQTQNIDE